MVIKRQKKSKAEEELLDEVNETVEKQEFRFDRVISTGSTLTDLAISGRRVRGGGIPGGVLAEFFGPSGGGKTTLLTSCCSSAQRKGGKARVRDPESRLDKEFAAIHGMSISDNVFDYARPDTIREFFLDFWNWEVDSDYLNVFAGDSIAALTTELELYPDKPKKDEEEKFLGDVRGQRQAKEFSMSLRKAARKLGNPEFICIFSNQVRQGNEGQEVTAGGQAVGFYASLRGRIAMKIKIDKTVELKSGVKFTQPVGILSEFYVKKSTIDAPFRSAPIYVMFDYGIDDIRGNLQWYKDMTKNTKYFCIDKEYVSMADARRYIEENNHEAKLRDNVIDLWLEIDEKLKDIRKPKVWF